MPTMDPFESSRSRRVVPRGESMNLWKPAVRRSMNGPAYMFVYWVGLIDENRRESTKRRDARDGNMSYIERRNIFDRRIWQWFVSSWEKEREREREREMPSAAKREKRKKKEKGRRGKRTIWWVAWICRAYLKCKCRPRRGGSSRFLPEATDRGCGPRRTRLLRFDSSSSSLIQASLLTDREAEKDDLVLLVASLGASY